jgi:hypothetical protein
MATKKEIEENLKIALDEIGEIKPVYNKKYGAWIFEHPSYPVGCEADSAEEVIKKYPLYLKEFIKERLNDNLAAFIEKKTIGRGGKREGAGRPLGTKKETKMRIYLPVDVARWIKTHPEALTQFRRLMAKAF